MQVVKQNLWGGINDLHCDAVVVTTNGFVKADGGAVMGRGCALELRQMVVGSDKMLGKLIKDNGNIVQTICTWYNGTKIVAFPVKPEKGMLANLVKHLRGTIRTPTVPGWAVKAELPLIEQSAGQLRELADKEKWQCVWMPMPGCGAGELLWKDVEPILDRILDKRFIICTK